MAHASEATTLVLLGLRLKGFGSATAVAEAVDLDVDVVTTQLSAARQDDHVLHREANDAWALTKQGRTHGQELLAAELSAAGARDVVDGAYRDFLELNPQMLQLCTDWQVRADRDGEELNDHSDPDYDAGIMSRLRALDAELDPLLDDLASTLGRYGRYRPAFDAALERLDAGEIEYLTKPIIPSYHTIWFELHEDLLATLGIDRASEGQHS